MVISSGLPYSYKISSWTGSETGKFRINNQIIQPSAIHFEEGMFALKSEYNRVVNKVSGYHFKVGSPDFFTIQDGKFLSYLNNRMSGSFDPNPSGHYLGGVLQLSHFSNIGSTLGARLPGAIHQKSYIQQMRELFDFNLSYYGQNGGAWATGVTISERTSGAKVDWLRVYKGYTDKYAISGMWYHNDTSIVGNDITFAVSGLYDRYLDEVRPQPMPYFGVGGDLSFTNIDHLSPWGNRYKMDKQNWPVVRPRYMMTDGSLPSGWASGLEIGRDNTVSPGTGIGGYIKPGISITISGGGGGLGSNAYMVSGVHGPSGMGTETRPDSPSWCSITNLKPSGSSIMVSGQYRIFMGHSSLSELGAFPWGTGMNTTRSAQWPWEGNYEPMNGQLQVVGGDFFDSYERNSSFWITDDTFAIQGDHGGTSSPPRLQSGIYWFKLNQGPSHSISVIDAWTQESESAVGIIAGLPYQSGAQSLWGLSKANTVRTQFSDGTVPVQILVGQGWDYDRTNNYYVKVGHSGLSANSVQQSGVYVRYNQQMVLIDNQVMPRTTIGGINWVINKSYRAVGDSTNAWLLGGAGLSGSTTNPLAADTVSSKGWFRLNSTFTIQDGLLFQGTNNDFYPVHIRKNGEYLGLYLDTGTPDTSQVNGKALSKYYSVNTITWGTLSAVNSTGSGTYTKTEYTMTFDSSVWAYLNHEASGKIHIGTFFETEPDNDLHCTLLSFASGAASGNGNTPDFWIAKINGASHPFNVTNVWRLGSCGTSYTNITAGNGLQVADVDIGSAAHFQVHKNG
jgi:hypothetical protein